MARLEKWGLVPHEFSGHCLFGTVSGHHAHADGTKVLTSRVKGQRGGKVVTEKGTEYELGEVAADYELEFPLAKERVFRALPVLD